MDNRVFQPLVEVTNLYRDVAGDRYRIGMPLNANIAADTIGRFAKGDRSDHLALIHENLDGSIEEYTYAELDDLASRFAVYLSNLGVERGEPVAIHTAQSPQTAIAHMAVYKLGAIALTLSHLYRPDAIAHVINDSKAKVIITNSDYWAALRDRLDQVKTLRHRIVFGNTEPGEISFSDCLKTSSEGFEPVITKTEEPGSSDVHIGFNRYAQGADSRASHHSCLYPIPDAGLQHGTQLSERSFLESSRLGLGWRLARPCIASLAARTDSCFHESAIHCGVGLRIYGATSSYPFIHDADCG